MNISPQINRLEFEQFLFNRIDFDLFKFKYLDNYIKAVNNSEKVVHSTSLLNVTDNGWILILHGEFLLIYGENWSSEQFDEIKTVFDLNNFRNYAIMGDSELVDEFLKQYETPYLLQKERIFYKSKTIESIKSDQLNIVLGDNQNSSELAEMLKQYYHEEYKGFNDKSIEEMIKRVDILIQTEAIYLLKNLNNEILSFCTIINPDIGILFTHRKHRGKGFGKILLSHCSRLLLNYNLEIYLMTDKYEESSNKICTGIGFEPFFNYKQILINHG